jgi:hypothetical protein
MPRGVAQLIFELYLPRQTPDNGHKQRNMVLATWITCEPDTVGCATTNDATTNECYNEQCYNKPFLSIKSGCYNERGGILSADVARACT